MIKRIALFLLLLAAGFAALLFLVQDEPGAQTVKPEPVSTERPRPSTGPTFVTKDSKGQEIGMQLGGELKLNTNRYRLTCTDSAPVGDGLQRLQDVKVELFDNGQHVANLKAKEATVEMGRDERGNPSVKQDKDVLLQDAVLTSVPGTKLPPLRFELQQARLHFVEQAVELTTPGERDPVLLVIEGARPSRLQGLGLKARLPNSASQGGRRLEAAVLHDPVFTTEQAVVRSRGRLDLTHDLETGSGRLTAVDDVRLELLVKIGLSLSGAGNADHDRGVTVTGDRLDAWLRHERQEQAATAASGRMQWTSLRITGTPALAQGQGWSLQGPNLSVLPVLDGRPFLLTASGGAAELVQTDAAGTSTFKAARNVHLLRPGMPAAAIHRSFGFPAWSLAQLERLQAAAFTGPASAALPNGTVAASDGLWLMRRGGDDDSDLTALGAGDVKVISNESNRMVTASGNDGFRLTDSRTGRSLVFGPEAPVAAHRYTIEYDDVVVRGTGACAFERLADGRAKAVLRSVNPDIDGDLGARGSVRGATAVDLVLGTGPLGATEITSLIASGPRVAGTMHEGGAFWNVEGARVERDHTGRWLLTGSPDRLATLKLRPDDQQRVKAGADQPGQVSAPVILLYELGPGCAVLEARADGKARVEVITGPSRDGHSLRLLADQLHELPCAVPRRVLDAHLGGTGAALGWLPGFALAQPWLIASGNVIADITEPDGRTHAECASLLLARGSQSALLIGDPEAQVPALLTRAESAGRTTFARAPRIQASLTLKSATVMDQSQGQTMRLLPTWPGLALSLPPRLELRDQHGSSTNALGNLAGTCRGEIEVLEDRVIFHGPVAAHALTPSGVEDPTGMHVTAEQLDMTLDPETGHVILVEGHQGVQLDWSRITARARELILDPIRSLCTVADPNGAEVTLPNGMKVKTVQARANYQTRSLETWHGRMAMPSSRGDRTGQ